MAVSVFGQLLGAAKADVLHLHAKALKLEDAVRVTETQDAHAGRLARLCRFARDRLGMAPAKVLPAQGPMPIFMQVLFVVDLSTSVGGDTLTNYISTLNVWYKERGLSPPSQHPELAAKLVGIRRAIGEQGGNERKRRTPLTLAPLRLMLRSLDKHAAAAPRGSAERLRCRRDAVATVVGFFGLLRKSELANAKLGELKNCHTHWTLKLPYSKVDQLRRGRTQWFAQRTASGIDIDALLTGYVEMLKNLGFGDNDPLLPKVARSKVTRAHLTFKGRVISEMIKACWRTWRTRRQHAASPSRLMLVDTPRIDCGGAATTMLPNADTSARCVWYLGGGPATLWTTTGNGTTRREWDSLPGCDSRRGLFPGGKELATDSSGVRLSVALIGPRHAPTSSGQSPLHDCRTWSAARTIAGHGTKPK